MTIYSHSRIASYEQCPLKYRYAYIDGLPRKGGSIEAFLGSRFHEVMERLYKRAPQSVPDASELKALFNRLWEENWSDDVVCRKGGLCQDEARALGLRAIDDYWKRYRPFDAGRVVGLERELMVDLDGSGRYRLRCIIDRLMAMPDGCFEVHDYKTGARTPQQRELDEDRQLALYEIAVRQAWPEAKGVDLVWHFVSSDMEMRSRRTPEALDELGKSIMARVDEIEAAGEFTPRESELCEWCDYQRVCPLFSHRYKAEGLTLEQYATDSSIGVVNRFAALDAEKHELNERLRRIEEEQDRLKVRAVVLAQEQGVARLFGDSHVLTIKNDIRVTYPKKGDLERAGFERAMHDLGIWERVVDVSWSALRALAHDERWEVSGAIPDQLSQFLKIEGQKMVRLSKRHDLGED